jgi:uncharacterized membrane protein YczE
VTGPSGILQVLPRLMSGLVLCSAGIAMMIRADLGLGPWDVLHQGLSVTLGIPIGMATILVGFLVLVLWLPLGERPGFGTVVNVITIGTMLDLILAMTVAPEAIWLRWLLLIVGPPLFSVGVGLYLGAGVGSGPRDGLMTGLARRGVPVALARTSLELTALGVGWLLGGTVGVGTVYFALAVGPVMHLVMPRLRAPWFPPGAQPRVLGGTPR